MKALFSIWKLPNNSKMSV